MSSELDSIHAQLRRLGAGQANVLAAVRRVEGQLARVEAVLKRHSGLLEGGPEARRPGLVERVALLEVEAARMRDRHRWTMRALLGAVLTLAASAVATALRYVLRS